MDKKPIRILVTGAAGEVAYALIPKIVMGDMLGYDQPVILHRLVDPSDANVMKDVKRELVDCTFPLLQDAIATTDIVEACADITVAFMVNGYPREEGVETKDVISEYVSVYESLASALANHAAANCKVLIVANPTDRIALILKKFAPSVLKKNITRLNRLYHNKAIRQVSHRLSVPACDVKNVIVRGSDSLTYYDDVNHATVNTPSGEKPVRELISDDAWLDGEFVPTVHRIWWYRIDKKHMLLAGLLATICKIGFLGLQMNWSSD